MPMAYKFTTGVVKMGVNSWPETVTRQRHGCDLNRGPTACKPVGYRVYGVACDREKKDLKARQAKHSMESVKSVMSDKTVKNKAERDRCVLSVSYAHTHTRVTALLPGLPRLAGTRKVKPIWIY